MPIYEYSCEKCSHEFEREQRITEDPIRKCPACGADRARRLISRTSFVLKGGGWYNDLYASPTSKPDAKPEGGEKPAAEAGGAPADEKKKPEKPARKKADGNAKSPKAPKSQAAA